MLCDFDEVTLLCKRCGKGGPVATDLKPWRANCLLPGEVLPDLPLQPAIAVEPVPDCIFKGKPTGEKVLCETCRGRVQLVLFGCQIFDRCTEVKPVADCGCCLGGQCPVYVAPTTP